MDYNSQRFIQENWFKLIVSIALVAIIFIGYQYYRINALKQCAEFGANLDEKLKKDIEASGGVGHFAMSNYRFKNNTCYRDVTYIDDIGTMHAFIENPFTKESFAACATKDGKPLGYSEDWCSKYNNTYNEIFEKIYP